ncbi:MAG: glycoside hydrolase family 99-like domain-containing protein [Clostridia bacterium]|nr:glycoside hydrolase family 99-like domain-containing protein [Clostridia bacterium]
MKKYDVAAYVWPSYTGDEPRTRIFWPEGYGEWQTVKDMKPAFPGHKWPRKPLWGYVNEADPFVMEMEIEAAASHGVNVFIYDWYWFDNRPFLEQCLNNGYLKARNNDKVKFFLMWANHTATSMWDKRTSDLHVPIWDGAVDRKTFDLIVKRTIQNYFTHPSYYKIDGKPVYLLFDLQNLIRGLGGVEETWRALDYFREETVKAGFPGLELHLTIRGREYMKKPADEKSGIDLFTFINKSGLDGLTHYQYWDFAPMGRPYPEILEDVKREWAYIDENMKALYYPHVSVGWDSNPRYQKLHPDVCVENTPENVQKGFALAKEYVDCHPNLKVPLITVNSWNEWTEGSYLQPDDLYGYGYLQALKKTFLD